MAMGNMWRRSTEPHYHLENGTSMSEFDGSAAVGAINNVTSTRDHPDPEQGNGQG